MNCDGCALRPLGTSVAGWAFTADTPASLDSSRKLQQFCTMMDSTLNYIINNYIY